MKGKKVAVIGAGVMGCDLALDLSSHDYAVILKDLTAEVLQKAEQNIQKNFKFIKMMKTDFPFSIEELLSRIKFVTDYSEFHDTEIVIENISEIFAEKKKLYSELRDICREDTLYGVNTSCITISKIAALLPRPENVIGMHFLNPVPLKNLVEVIKGFQTSAQTLERTKDFLGSLNKTWVVVNDAPGFVANRVLMLTINESIRVVQEGITEAKDVDKIFRLGFGHKMGPLATADLIGLDTIRDSLQVLYESYNDPKYLPCPLLQKMVKDGILGKKTGRGFFVYEY
ncbi:MAG: 3-hydroxyacyl-CoA dehydrogenase family protein [Candidatus Aminicenantes bacterium]|nr:3-hydroxyacyl-CoA dehydrogenase family protein [Candidatus Aminicenantes bacterium]